MYLEDTYHSPGTDRVSEDIKVGETVQCSLIVEGHKAFWETLNAFCRILYTDSGGEHDCKSVWNINMDHGEQKAIECSFTMPNETVALRFVGGHAAGGVWVDDFDWKITLNPVAPLQPRGTIIAWLPGRNADTAVGSSVHTQVRAFNNGYGAGYVYTIIKKDDPITGEDVTPFVYEWKEAKSSWDELYAEGNFIMPSRAVTLYCIAGHFDVTNNDWVVDDTESCTLTPMSAATCIQWFTVKDAATGRILNGATINPGIGQYCVVKDGRCAIELEDGKTYSVQAALGGFDPQTKSLVACTGSQAAPFAFELEPTTQICRQYFQVLEDEENTPVQGVYVAIAGVEALTNVGGIAYMDLMTGNSYTVVAYITNYDPSGSYTFTACEGDQNNPIVLKIHYNPPPPPGEPFGKIMAQIPACSAETPCSAEKGQELEFKVRIKNIGDKKGKFMIYLYDDTTDELLEKEPCIGIPFTDKWVCNWKDLDPGEEYEGVLDTKWSAFLAMPDYNWPLRIEVREISRELEAEPDDVNRFTMMTGGPAGHVLILDGIPKTLYVDEEFTFIGELSQNGVAVANAQIRIFDKDLLWGDFIAEGVTDANGEFSIPWLIENLDVYGDLEIYAEHPQSGTKSVVQKITISKEKVADTKKLLIYGGLAVGLYAGGTIIGGIGESGAKVKGMNLKPIGTGMKVISIIPAGLAVYEGYKIAQEKLPF